MFAKSVAEEATRIDILTDYYSSAILTLPRVWLVLVNCTISAGELLCVSHSAING